MDKIIIEGGVQLNGSIALSGSKNTALPIIAASILCNEEIVLSDLPNIQDVLSMLNLVSSLGAEVTVRSPVDNGFGFPSRQVVIHGSKINNFSATYEIVRKMRASVLILGPLLARFGKAKISLPGGCTIGTRPVNLHIEGLEKMGAKIEINSGFIDASVDGKLRGAIIEMPFVSVGATENILSAAILADGETVIKNAAKEPEVVSLGLFLQKMGAKISGLGTSEIIINGIDRLIGVDYKIPSDRIEAGTYAIAAAATNGKIILHNTSVDSLKEFESVFKSTGVKITQNSYNSVIAERDQGGLKACRINTEPYPGFPTDMQAQIMALLLCADGISEISENIFENRFMHVPELLRMGAKIDISRNKATINGGIKLRGASVMASDLRASVALIIAGLTANDVTTVNRIYHLDRGYEFLNEKLVRCGAKLSRVRE